ncbi:MULTISPECIES: hypothetical protein [unclassified Campylobacter]|uniref:hypothetical protein n=1 Tax=unclassified Campylobacter TaxID=2593542 RepID=UPI001237DF0F|nr:MULTISPECIES: hypothetical protein [unclassified Campylobacter]KAA6225380.1 hypothetical protein FMM54_06350 [Campylobacter sp. LR185c]KAA6227076.1 hypothetical protein FMM55_03745 [Campylobacter sp. LR196d]KAA6228702.1 hypothetical protein FMM57_02210 [Campylobacter sp. LR286c]KAA6229512.1 hypothetical protein FMM56_08165 [Campylobacter sp. LR264d]KAA6230756.1 hypothetical protein FMM58_04920 [Campylobacter sp. LR291e]
MGCSDSLNDTFSKDKYCSNNHKDELYTKFEMLNKLKGKFGKKEEVKNGIFANKNADILSKFYVFCNDNLDVTNAINCKEVVNIVYFEKHPIQWQY